MVKHANLFYMERLHQEQKSWLGMKSLPSSSCNRRGKTAVLLLVFVMTTMHNITVQLRPYWGLHGSGRGDRRGGVLEEHPAIASLRNHDLVNSAPLRPNPDYDSIESLIHDNFLNVTYNQASDTTVSSTNVTRKTGKKKVVQNNYLVAQRNTTMLSTGGTTTANISTFDTVTSAPAQTNKKGEIKERRPVTKFDHQQDIRHVRSNTNRGIDDKPGGSGSGSGSDIQFHDNKPILIVGGTDGSGTRAFVDMLNQLGVIVVADDLGAYDVHASEIFDKQGWPPFVKMVLNETHSADYQWSHDDLSNATRQRLLDELVHFTTKTYDKYNIKKNQRQSRARIAHQRGAKMINFEVASKISFVIKAPVSMLVLPVLQQAFDRPIKFLHVVRDGRDIALGNNQSPVMKYYETMYNHDPSRSTKEQTKLFGDENLQSIRAMQLWNDWNLQVQSMLKSSDIEFLTMRSEDLISHDTRWRAINALADFIGTPYSDREICCKAQEDTQDFGQSMVRQQKGHDGTSVQQTAPREKDGPPPISRGRRLVGTSSSTGIDKNVGSAVHKRYGKWQALLVDRPELSDFLHQEGKEALSVFGYEPVKTFTYDISTNTTTAKQQPFVCSKAVRC